jgi:hypothetical protein
MSDQRGKTKWFCQVDVKRFNCKMLLMKALTTGAGEMHFDWFLYAQQAE